MSDYVPPTLEQLLDAMEDELKIALHYRTQKGGQQVPYHGDFAAAGISTMLKLKDWWIREFREAFKRHLTDYDKKVLVLERELERHRHGETIESDFICPHELEAYQLRMELKQYSRWVCQGCGATYSSLQPIDARWRWTGEAYEHQCGHPQAGCFPAVQEEKDG